LLRKLLSFCPADDRPLGARLRRTAVCALDYTLAVSPISRRADLFDRRLDVPPHERPLQIAPACEFDVAHSLAFAFEHTIRIRERRAGFDYFYGFVGGDANQWQPNLFRNTTAIYPYYNSPGWNLVTAQADDAIEYLDRVTAINTRIRPVSRTNCTI
jgi:hypothetical protein